MRFILVVIAALASSTSAIPTHTCPSTCFSDSECQICAVPRICHLRSESYFCFHIGAVWPLALTRQSFSPQRSVSDCCS
ncbi:hypothetical protein F4604DRAFT_1787646 [Suillus subluteus]|nr:hypothetical protein F4604DRAFT_1787646 [Suillus subluteus]